MIVIVLTIALIAYLFGVATGLWMAYWEQKPLPPPPPPPPAPRTTSTFSAPGKRKHS